MTATDNRVFISYARLDGDEFASELAARLKAAGFDPWFDRISIGAGSSWSRMIDQGLDTAWTLLVVLTPGSELSAEVQGEWYGALDRHVPVVPLLVEECEIPRRLQSIQYLDFRGGVEPAFTQLVERLHSLPTEHLAELRHQLDRTRQVQAKARNPQPFEAKIASLEAAIARWESRMQAASAATPSPVVEAHRTRIAGRPPWDQPDIFTGRTAQLEEIGRMLAEEQAQLVSVLGRGGMGKTALACQVLRDLERGKWPHRAEGPRIDGIAYLSTRTHGITFDQLFVDCTKLLENERKLRLGTVRTSRDLELDERLARLFDAFEQGLYIVLLDNLEDLLDAEGQLADPEVAAFFREALRSSRDGLRLVATSRRPLQLDPDLQRLDRHVWLRDGLSLDEGIKLLRELDPNDEFEIRSAGEEQLAEVVRRTHGVPRALQLIPSIFRQRVFVSLDEVVADFYTEEEVVEKLVEENYRLLSQDARRVAEAVAVFGVPVPPQAIAELLQPFLPELDVLPVLRQLVRTHVVQLVDRGAKTVSLHPIDQEYLYHRLRATGPYSRAALHARAAEFYRSQRTSEPDGYFGFDTNADLDALAPRFAEFNHRVRAGQPEEAAEVLAEFGSALALSGSPTRCNEMVQAIAGRVKGDRARLTLLACEMAIRIMVGPLPQVLEMGPRAREIAAGLGSPLEEAGIEVMLGITCRYLGDAHQAITHYERAAELYGRCHDTATKAFFSDLSLCHSYTGNVREALRYAEQMLDVAEHTTDPYHRFKAHNTLSLAYFAWGRWEEAIQHSCDAIAAWRPGMNDGRAYVANTLGMAHFLAGHHPRALAALRDGIDAALELESPRAGGFCLYDLAMAHYLLDAAAQAREPAVEAQPLLAAAGHAELSAAMLVLLDAAVSGDRAAEARALLDCARHSVENPDVFPPRELAARTLALAAELGLDETAADAERLLGELTARLILPDE
ncbi:MAG: toll/interleukin-1 receptor domain-containing protein [Longimicrobiaceae bacterium]